MRISDWSSDVCSSDLTVAGAIAAAAGAARLLMLTDVIGVLDKTGELIPELNTAKIEALRADGTISGGMIPKLETCMKAVSEGAEAVVILDGRVANSLRLENFTGGGIGTLISRGGRAGGLDLLSQLAKK